MDLTYSFVRSRKAKTLIPDHSHQKYEFVYFFGGKGTVYYEGNSVPFSRGTYYIMRDNVVHSELYENTGISLVVQFMPTDDVLQIDSIVLSDAVLNLSHICDQMRAELKDRRFGYEVIIDSCMREIMTLIARMQHTKADVSGNGIKDAILYLDQYFMTEIKIGDLAKECGYSTDHFCVLFKQQTNSTPKKYILSKRLKLAKKLLKETELTITEISLRCGFDSYSQFMTFFKQRTGYTPNGYRDTYFSC